MGISDLIPGVSGGTIALITGIYNDFIHSLNNIKFKNIIKLFKGNFLTNLTYFKFDILLTIVLGIISSIIIFSQIISNAIDIHPTKVFSFFFGLILLLGFHAGYEKLISLNFVLVSSLIIAEEF